MTDFCWIFLIGTKMDIVLQENINQLIPKIKEFKNKYDIKYIWRISSIKDSQESFENILEKVARIIYNEMDGNNTMASGLNINKVSLLKYKSLVGVEISKQSIKSKKDPTFISENKESSCC